MINPLDWMILNQHALNAMLIPAMALYGIWLNETMKVMEINARIYERVQR